MSALNSDTVRDSLIAGLHDAHGMETQAITLLSAQVERLKHYPQLQERVRVHLHETEGQRDRLEKCLQYFGASPSILKDAAVKSSATFQSMLHSFASEEVIRNSRASYGYECYEIISYKALIETARLCGAPEVERACRESLVEEERMAAFLNDHLPRVVQEYLARASAKAEPKR